MAKPALGRGLSALLGAVTAPAKPSASPFAQVPASANTAETAVAPPDNSERVRSIPLGRVRPCPFQPRKDFAEESISELADSIRAQGIVQPLIVRSRGDHFELIAGERRWRAAQQAGLAEVPVIVREADDRAVLELALIENLQRENLNSIEEALGYAQLINQFALTQETVATKVGKSRAVVANALRLLRLEPEIQLHLRQGRLSVGHAKVVLGLPLPAQQRLAVERILKAGLNVRQTEELVARLQQPVSAPGQPGAPPAPVRDVHVAHLENRLHERFGTKVFLKYRQGKGSLEIRFFNDADLERILEIVGVSAD